MKQIRNKEMKSSKVYRKLNQSTDNNEIKKNIKEFLKLILHGQRIRSVDRQLIGGAAMLLWLLRGDTTGETGSEIIAANKIRHCELNIIQQKYYKQEQRENVECKQSDETMEHIISACPIMAKEQYLQRYDLVCAEMHCNMCKEIGGNYTKNSCRNM
jgi:hypothetical protein